MQAQFINHLQVEVLPVYYPSPEEASSPRLYADNVRKLMAGALGAELCDHGLAAHTRLKKNRIAVDWTGRWGTGGGLRAHGARAFWIVSAASAGALPGVCLHAIIGHRAGPLALSLKSPVVWT